jgi:hypothetical protein
MQPDPREIAAVLAAPEPVREALRRCEGPGWSHTGATYVVEEQVHGSTGETMWGRRDIDARDPGAWELAIKPDGLMPWLPVDPTAIVVEAARTFGTSWSIEPVVGMGGPRYRAWTARGEVTYGETPRLAALALLTAVLAGGR